MWHVFFTKEAENGVMQLDKNGLLDADDKKIIATWIKQVKKHGPDSLRAGKNIWYDHDLKGKWNGYRSSSYSYAGRIIYQVHEKKIIVKVVRITPDHDYKA